MFLTQLKGGFISGLYNWSLPLNAFRVINAADVSEKILVLITIFFQGYILKQW